MSLLPNGIVGEENTNDLIMAASGSSSQTSYLKAEMATNRTSSPLNSSS